MNLLEHYIVKIYSEQNVTSKYKDLSENMYLVDLEYDCYGAKERKRKIFSESELKKAKKNGYFLG